MVAIPSLQTDEVNETIRKANFVIANSVSCVAIHNDKKNNMSANTIKA
jgi:hypothetical protein